MGWEVTVKKGVKWGGRVIKEFIQYHLERGGG